MSKRRMLSETKVVLKIELCRGVIMKEKIIYKALAKECKNEEVWYTCYQCGKCGRVFENGFMVDDGGTTIEKE